jgi:hypothetical protein
MDFANISNYTIEIYFVLFYFGQRLYMQMEISIIHLIGSSSLFNEFVFKLGFVKKAQFTHEELNTMFFVRRAS